MLAALGLSAIFIAIVLPALDRIFWDYDEGWYVMGARHVARGHRPFVDFAYNQPSLYLNLLALSGQAFGPTVFGYRMLSLLSMALCGILLFRLTLPFVGTLPALAAQALFLFSRSQIYALGAVPEPAMLLFSLAAVLLLFLGRGALSACFSAAAFVVALLIKPTCMPLVLVAALSLAWARAYQRLAYFAATGVILSVFAFAWMTWASDGAFASTVAVNIRRLSTHNVGMWAVDTGFKEIRQQLGIDTSFQWALFCLRNFCVYPETYVPMALLLLSLIGIPIWVIRCAGSHPALRVFAVSWPAACVLLNFFLVDYVSDKYFIPFLACSSFLLAAVAWSLQRRIGASAFAGVGLILSCALAVQTARALNNEHGNWYQRAKQIVAEHPAIVSFTPMVFAATGAEPGCGFDNPAFTYGGFGDGLLVVDQTRHLRFSDERLVQCLRANPQLLMLVDWGFYFFTRPGSPLRTYLANEGSPQRLFWSPQAQAQWDQPVLTMMPE
jgi:hypothetical protein